MEIKKIYLQPSMVVYKGMHDLMDAQRGVEVFDDYTQRVLHFKIMMFDIMWVLRFAAVPIDMTRCEVALAVYPETPGTHEELLVLADFVLRREYAILDAMLLIGTSLDVNYGGGDELL